MDKDIKEAGENLLEKTALEGDARSPEGIFGATVGADTGGNDTLIEPSQFALGSQDKERELAEARTVAASASASFPNGSAGDASNRHDSESGRSELSRSGASLGPGETIGRLVLGDTLGTGAFGRVVMAYDSELKRKLAVKILKPEVFASAGGKDAQKRLLREARAMAKISHPNVVTVHDIGMVNEQVFVAMEYVQGCNLREWLDEEARSLGDILPKFIAAGQGLAAAHREGLVHRDFKPDNVLVGTKGQVCVADFGLVSVGSRGGDKIGSTEFAIAIASEEINLTQAGALMGTALFMAPEQHRGEEVTPACDQFSYCVALYQALTGKQPFSGTTYQGLRKNVLGGRLRPISASAKVPKWLQALLKTGLARNADDRHSSMDVLLAALQAPPSPKGPRVLRLLAIPLLGLSLYGGFALTREDRSVSCADPDKTLVGVWDGATQERISAVFSAADRQSAFTVYRASVDKHVEDWRSLHAAVCEISESQSAAAQAGNTAQKSCLSERLSYLSELSQELQASKDNTLLDRAVKAVVNMSPLNRCSQERVSFVVDPLPPGAEERREVQSLNDVRHKAQALFDLGRLAEAGELLASAVDSEMLHAGSWARSRYLLGKIKTDLGLLDEAELLLHKAVDLGTQAGDDILVARAWLALQFLEGVERENFSRSDEFARMAELSFVRGRASESNLASLKKARAAVLMRKGKIVESIALLEEILPLYVAEGVNLELASLLSALGDAKVAERELSEAVGHYRLALAHIESLLGASHPENIYVLNNMSVALKYQGDIEGAKDVLLRSLRLTEHGFGNASIALVPILTNLTSIYRRLGQLDAAEAAGRRAISVGSTVAGDYSHRVTKAMTNLAIVMITKEEFPEATALFRKVLKRHQASFEGDHPAIASSLNNVGESLVSEGKTVEAIALLVLSMEMKIRIYGVEHHKAASTYLTLAMAYEKVGKDLEALKLYQQALPIYSAAAGPDHDRTNGVRSSIGHVQLGRNETASAVRILSQAVASRGDDPSVEQGRDRFALARGLWALGRKSEARKLTASLEKSLAQDSGSEKLHRELILWIETH
ncbi:MAG: tetratricopeptide repeat protein [Kofleriaceae bacterium]|nr:tetratricopeptide repeat protein [Kofleriaceae bacterium]